MNTNDQTYWNTFYQNKSSELNKPSDFCIFVMNYFKSKDLALDHVLDAGCGNGRDSCVLATQYKVLGVDNSGFNANNTATCIFRSNDFVTMDKTEFDMVYSRFTFHSITNENHETFLASIKPGTYLCIETRSDKGIDDKRHYGDDHYRNFTNLDYLKKLLKNGKFDIQFIEENKDLAIYKNENPYCIRVICKKQ